MEPRRHRVPEMDAELRSLLVELSLHRAGCDGRDGPSTFLERMQRVEVWRLENPLT